MGLELVENLYWFELTPFWLSSDTEEKEGRYNFYSLALNNEHNKSYV